MDQSVDVLLVIDKAYTVPQRALDCRPGIGGLNPLLRVSVASITTSLPGVQLGIS